jgi:hypothetical protein
LSKLLSMKGLRVSLLLERVPSMFLIGS